MEQASIELKRTNDSSRKEERAWSSNDDLRSNIIILCDGLYLEKDVPKRQSSLGGLDGFHGYEGKNGDSWCC